MNDRFPTSSSEGRTETYSAPVVVAEYSMILDRGLTQQEKIKFKRLESRIADLFRAAGAIIRLCEGIGEGEKRTIGLIPGLIGLPLVSLTATQFLTTPDELLLRDLERQIDDLSKAS
jgi:hypothetical protein